jgi:hypothetical protein
MMNDYQRVNWNVCGRKLSWLNYSDIFLEGQRKTKKNLSLNSWFAEILTQELLNTDGKHYLLF